MIFFWSIQVLSFQLQTPSQEETRVKYISHLANYWFDTTLSKEDFENKPLASD